ncbi:MAG: very short patch repair endonuclease [Geothrix sp.]|nr:very short patch repair endonuclease [Geothrix sp.]
MADSVSPGKRSWIMAQIKGKDTLPELAVRSMAHRMGFRFRLHSAGLPGKPDLVFPRLGRVVFVHGCFWHGHRCREGRRVPKSNQSYWISKIAANKARDARTRRKLRRAGWSVLVVWECQLKAPNRLQPKLWAFLSAPA